MLVDSDLVESPLWFPLRLADRETVTVVKLDEAAYRCASFLDERLLTLNSVQERRSLTALARAAAAIPNRPHYIFHIGHVGSTLISRLLGASDRFFALREPFLLRTFIDPPNFPPAAESAGWGLESLLALLGRSWRPGQRAVVKTTSIVNEIAGVLLGGGRRPTAIFLYVHALVYLRGIFGGPNSRVEARHLAPARMRRLRRLLGDQCRLDPRSEGEVIAMNWLCEMASLHDAGQQRREQVLWMDFEDFLRAPSAGLDRLFRALGTVAPATEIESITQSPLMRQYSKAPEYDYDAELRREVMELADREHGVEIKRGMHWLSQLAGREPLVRSVIEGRGD